MMKYFYFFVFIMLLNVQSIGQNFEQVYPNYDVGQLEYFEMNDAGIGYVIGKCNILYSTTNGGDTWELKTLPTASSFSSKVLNLSDDKNSEAIFRDRSDLYISKNNGDDWTKVVTNIDQTITGTYSNIAIANNGDILVNTFNGVLIKSQDKGMTWEVIDVGATVRLNYISVSNGSNVWVTDNKSNLYFSNDNGTTWSPVYSHPERISKFEFINDKIGFLVDQKSKMFKTIDGGENWLPHMESATLITSQMFIRSENEYWFNNNLTIFTTPDAGVNWVNITRPMDIDIIFSFISFDKDAIWLIGTNNVIMKSLDNGTSWKVMNEVVASNLNNAIVNNDEIVAVGNHGYLLSSKDGGDNWKEEKIGDFKIHDIERIDNQSVMLATQDGLKIFKSGVVQDQSDISEAVIILDTERSSKRMLAVTQTSPSELWASDDNGASWNMIEQFPFSARGLEIVSRNNYVIFGGRTEIMKTTDAGKNWQKIEIPEANYVHDISSYEGNKIVVLNALVLLFSDDFGETFSRQSSGPRVSSAKMVFTNDKVGYVVGDKGFESEFYETQDGGIKWTLISGLCSRGSKIILNSEKHEIWIPAQGGSIYRWSDEMIATEDEYNSPSSNMELTVFPNPSSGNFTLSGFDDEVNNAHLTIYNLQGQNVYSQSNYDSKDEINVIDLTKGFYWVKINTTSKKYYAKIIIN